LFKKDKKRNSARKRSGELIYIGKIRISPRIFKKKATRIQRSSEIGIIAFMVFISFL